VNAATKRQVKIERRQDYGRSCTFPVLWQGERIGDLEKWRDDRHTKNPYKAVLYLDVPDARGQTARMVGAFFAEDGGKGMALDALLVARDRAIEEGLVGG